MFYVVKLFWWKTLPQKSYSQLRAAPVPDLHHFWQKLFTTLKQTQKQNQKKSSYSQKLFTAPLSHHIGFITLFTKSYSQSYSQSTRFRKYTAPLPQKYTAPLFFPPHPLLIPIYSKKIYIFYYFNFFKLIIIIYIFLNNYNIGPKYTAPPQGVEHQIKILFFC